ncbi:hypothetical protein U1Q18_036619 [Sarracenia purpurea var. burkii]
MGEKKSKNGGEKKKNDEQQQNKKNRSSEGSGKDNPPITVVFKVHMDCQCEGCAPRIKKCVRVYEGLCSPPRQIRQIRALFRLHNYRFPSSLNLKITVLTYNPIPPSLIFARNCCCSAILVDHDSRDGDYLTILSVCVLCEYSV